MEDEYFSQWIAELKELFGPGGNKLIPDIWHKFFDAGMSPEQVLNRITYKGYISNK